MAGGTTTAVAQGSISTTTYSSEYVADAACDQTTRVDAEDADSRPNWRKNLANKVFSNWYSNPTSGKKKCKRAIVIASKIRMATNIYEKKQKQKHRPFLYDARKLLKVRYCLPIDKVSASKTTWGSKTHHVDVVSEPGDLRCRITLCGTWQHYVVSIVTRVEEHFRRSRRD